MKETEARKLLANIPKTEIHLHIEAVATVNTLWELLKKNDLKVDGITTKEDLSKKFKIKSLEEFLWLYNNIVQYCFKSEDDFKYLIKDTREYLKRNNIVYAEIFFAPSKFIQNGLSFEKMINVLHQGALDIKNEDNREIKYIIDVSRSFGLENAKNNLELTLKHKTDSIIGIGLGGAEAKGPAKEYKEVFEAAAKAGIHVVAHAGEDVGPESVWDAIKLLKAERIGHGISSVYDNELMKEIIKSQIPLEVCPTSNIFTRKFVTKLENHPIRKLYDEGVNVTLNTDDPVLFNVDLIDEYINLMKYLSFDLKEILELIKNNLYATFLSKERKDKLWSQVKATVKNSTIKS